MSSRRIRDDPMEGVEYEHQNTTSTPKKKIQLQESPTPYRRTTLTEKVTLTRFHRGVWPQSLINSKIAKAELHRIAYPWTLSFNTGHTIEIHTYPQNRRLKMDDDLRRNFEQASIFTPVAVTDASTRLVEASDFPSEVNSPVGLRCGPMKE